MAPVTGKLPTSRAPFDPVSVCAKCGFERASARWCPGTGVSDRQAGCDTPGEHLHRSCGRCGWTWQEATLDASPEETAPERGASS